MDSRVGNISRLTPILRKALVFAVLTLAGCKNVLSPAERYQHWLAQGEHRAQVQTYAAHLREHSVDDLVPMRELLRSGRRWQWCDVDEFAIPPREDWSRIVPTLALIRDLRDAGLIQRPKLVSAWRSNAFNQCEGGSSKSRHMINNALDIEIAGKADNVARLCGYWRKHGQSRKFGLGFYTATKIHVDTSGFRTWGGDFTCRSSLCTSQLL